MATNKALPTDLVEILDHTSQTGVVTGIRWIIDTQTQALYLTETPWFLTSNEEETAFAVVTNKQIDDPIAFVNAVRLLRELVQVHRAPAEISDATVIRLLAMFDEPQFFIPQSNVQSSSRSRKSNLKVFGIEFHIPTIYHETPEGIACMVADEIFRLRMDGRSIVSDKLSIQWQQSVIARNKKYGYRRPTSIDAAQVPDLLEKIRLIQENSRSGSTPAWLAKEYERDPDTMRYHLKTLKERGRISDWRNISSDELNNVVRPYLAMVLRNPRK